MFLMFTNVEIQKKKFSNLKYINVHVLYFRYGYDITTKRKQRVHLLKAIFFIQIEFSREYRPTEGPKRILML